MALLQQQLAQLTFDFKHNLRLLEERDAELERLEVRLAGTLDSLTAKEAALADARRTLADRESSLRERDGQLAAMEARHIEALSLMSRQVEAARASRDEELDRLRGETAASVTAATTKHDALVARARAAEAELKAGTQRLREENETLRSAAQRAEARAAEAELAANRATSKFESALATLRQMEEQYQSLSADATTAERLRTERVLVLEAEVESLRVVRAAAARDQETAVSEAMQRVAEAEARADDAVARHQRSELAAADASVAAATLRQEVQSLAARCAAAESEAAKWREEAIATNADLERQRGAYSGAQSLLEATKLALEASQREAERLRASIVEAEGRWAGAIAEAETARRAATAAERDTVQLGERLDGMGRSAAKEAEEFRLQVQLLSADNAALKESLDAAVAEAAHLRAELARIEVLSAENITKKGEGPAKTDGTPSHLAETQQAPVVDVFAFVHEDDAKTPTDFENVDHGEREDEAIGLHLSPKKEVTVESLEKKEAELRRREAALDSARQTLLVNGYKQSKSTLAAQSSKEQEDLVMENARLRQQLADVKLSLSNPKAMDRTGEVSYMEGRSIFSTRVISDGHQPQISSVNDLQPLGGPAKDNGGRAGGNVRQIEADDALAKARRQVMLAKEYLRRVAHLGPDVVE